MVELSSIKMKVLNRISSTSPNYWNIEALSISCFIVNAAASHANFIPINFVGTTSKIRDYKLRFFSFSDNFVIDFIIVFFSIDTNRREADRSNRGCNTFFIYLFHFVIKPHCYEYFFGFGIRIIIFIDSLIGFWPYSKIDRRTASFH